jgi:hypothetical protein
MASMAFWPATKMKKAPKRGLGAKENVAEKLGEKIS